MRADEDLFMNGGEIFAFTMTVVPPLCREVLQRAGWAIDSVDYFVMHQANRFMLQHLSRTMRIPKDRLVLALENYGNTSSASIPLAMAEALRPVLAEGSSRLVLTGFGVDFPGRRLRWNAVRSFSRISSGLTGTPDILAICPWSERNF